MSCFSSFAFEAAGVTISSAHLQVGAPALAQLLQVEQIQQQQNRLSAVNAEALQTFDVPILLLDQTFRLVQLALCAD